MMLVWINNSKLKDYGLQLLSRTIESPAVKRATVDVPYRDGSIDLMTALSDVPHYQNRQITMSFELMEHIGRWEAIRSELYNLFHGRKVQVVFSGDESYFWEGICSIGAVEYHGFTAGLEITVDAYPLKRTRRPVLRQTFTLEGTATKIYNVGNHRGFARFSVDSSVVISDGVESYTVTPTRNEAYGLYIGHGENTLTFTGSGPVVVEIFGGDL